MEDSFKNNTSKYNEAMLQIQRLHDSWIKCNAYARSGKLQLWKWELDIIWRELSTDVRKVDSNDEKEILEIFESYKAENIRQLNDRFKILSRIKKGKDFYSLLDDRHQFLKHLQDCVGKGGVWTDGFDDDFE